MAVVEMNKLRLVGLSRECDKVLGALAGSGAFEVCPTVGVDAVSQPFDPTHLDRLISKQVKAAFAVEYLKTLDSEAAGEIKENVRRRKRGLTLREFDYKPLENAGKRLFADDAMIDSAANSEYELLAKSDELEKINFERLEIKSELTRLEYRINSLKPYINFPLKFSQIRDTKKSSRMLFFGDAATANLSRLDEADFPAVHEQYDTAKGVLALVITLKEHRQSALDLMAKAGFGCVEMSDDRTAKELIKECIEKREELEARDFELFKDALGYFAYFDDLRVLYDVLGSEIEKAKAENGFVRTRESFVLQGWIPESETENIIEKIKSATQRVCIFVSKPEPEDNPPTLVENPKLIAPFEDVTNLYSPPAYGEIDPNPFMAVFFFIFYGFMMADAGYGVLMTAIALIALKVMKPEKGTARLITLIGICGVSTVVWGVLFGGLFGIEGVPPLWFNPLEKPLPMFGLSLGLGVIQIVFGYGLYTAKMFGQKKYFAGIIDVVFKITIIIGVGLVLLNLLLGLSSAFTTAGIVVIFASLVGIIATAGHNSKSIGGKIVGGFAGLYDLVNLLSDILSYARLFGLALASGAIALAFNTLGSLFFGLGVVGYIIGIIVLIPLHAFNLGLGLLSGYVHNARLQFIEFYNKFYDGGGRIFSPMGEKTRYIRRTPKEAPVKKRSRHKERELKAS